MHCIINCFDLLMEYSKVGVIAIMGLIHIGHFYTSFHIFHLSVWGRMSFCSLRQWYSRSRDGVTLWWSITQTFPLVGLLSNYYIIWDYSLVMTLSCVHAKKNTLGNLICTHLQKIIKDTLPFHKCGFLLGSLCFCIFYWGFSSTRGKI